MKTINRGHIAIITYLPMLDHTLEPHGTSGTHFCKALHESDVVFWSDNPLRSYIIANYCKISYVSSGIARGDLNIKYDSHEDVAQILR